jgi:hypothetical protein
MKHENGFTLLEVIVFLFIVFGLTGWSVNLAKLVNCDFKTPYKAEVIRTIGLIPPIGMIVGWIDLGK